MRKFSKRSLGNLEGVHPDLVAVITAALQRTPLDFIVIDGLRTRREQEVLVAKGKSKTMNSRHLTGHAVDILPIGPKGPAFDWDLYHQIAPSILKVAEEMGVDLEWGGVWKSFPDGPHFQLSRSSYPAGVAVSHLKPSEEPGPVELTEPKPKRKNVAQSSTVQAAAGTAIAGAAGVFTALSRLDPTAQVIVAVCACVALMGLGWILRERIRKWAAGDR